MNTVKLVRCRRSSPGAPGWWEWDRSRTGRGPHDRRRRSVRPAHEVLGPPHPAVRRVFVGLGGVAGPVHHHDGIRAAVPIFRDLVLHVHTLAGDMPGDRRAIAVGKRVSIVWAFTKKLPCSASTSGASPALPALGDEPARLCARSRTRPTPGKIERCARSADASSLLRGCRLCEASSLTLSRPSRPDASIIPAAWSRRAASPDGRPASLAL